MSIIKTTLKAGRPNRFARTGRYFYLLTAADSLRIQFDSDQNGFKTLNTEMREGMSNVFDLKVESITLDSDTDQYVEFWLSDTSLDYSKLAAGGASATIDSGRAVCELGSSLAIHADFRRKKITVQALVNLSIGGVGVDAASGYFLKAGESLTLGTRGDIYGYLTPAEIGGVGVNNTLTSIPAALGDADGLANTDSLKLLYFDKTTNNLITGYGKLIYSVDMGVSWLDSDTSGTGENDQEIKTPMGQTATGVFVVTGDGTVLVSRDGGASFRVYSRVEGALNNDTGLPVNDCFMVASAWISADETNLIITDYYGIWESFDSGKSWSLYSRSLSVHLPSSANIVPMKAGGVLYLGATGDVVTYDYTTKEITRKTSLSVGSGEDYFAVMGEKMYHYNTQSRKLIYSENGFDTYEQETMTPTVDFIGQFGATLLISDVDKVGFAKFGEPIQWVNAALSSGKTKGGAQCVVTNESIIVKQTNTTVDPDSKASVYPATILDGAQYPASLQWLAELN
jgi:hypothetical protein